MSSGSGAKKHPLIRSFGFAITGIRSVVMNERNMRIHLVISLIVIVTGLWFSISMFEWLFVILAIGGMFALEMVNSAIERVVDLVTDKYHPLAKDAKDIAAGAVLLYAIVSVIIGLIIFAPKILMVFK
jgi:undecaprenol kinase